ncbi:hypothetical protein FXN61_05500 [Lentzea sp. PSKA42]|uniref:Uncharacterized protein n=1 Tax=Lentzea indica TaxID=2604800 RepID=A0ABX1FBK6_9PSEU|nr:hypothetical protein [Lentzea indica]NKE56309.1 hypothetical protein [Lentzea indica]
MGRKASLVLWAVADVIAGVVAVGLLINVTSGLLPEPLTEPQVAWPALLLVSAVVAALAVRRIRQSEPPQSPNEALEQQRRHDELTPQFDITYRRSGSSDVVTLCLAFVGPLGLDRLDSVEVAVRNDRPDRRPVTAGPPTAEDIASVIWSPYRLRPGVDRADRMGRCTPAVPLDRGEVLYRTLELSLTPHWVPSQDFWRQQYADQPVRLTLTCTRKDHSPWVLPMEITIPSPASNEAS